MKKIISVLAMTLLVIGAAQAQEQVRKMFVRTNDGKIVKIKVADIEDVTFEMDIDLPNVPTTIEEAKAMLVGYWKVYVPIDDLIESSYFIITEDLKVLECYKFKDSFPDEEYAGKYVAGEFGEITFPNEEDPTTFYLGSEWYYGTNLQMESFYYNIDDGDISTFPCVRVEPFEYIIMDYDLMKK